MSFVLVQLLTALANASALFLVAVGLSIIFGVTRIVNFAHGSFYMLGAYLAYSAAEVFMAPLGGLGFWLALPAAALGAALAGVVMEVAILRRLYGAEELLPLLATFAVVLLVQDGVLALWGPEDLVGPRAPGLSSAVAILGHKLPQYDLFLIAIGPLTLAGLWLLFQKTAWGVRVRAATEDREMVAALGIDQKRLFTAVVALGTALAGLGGALQLPREPASLGMDLNIIAEAFVVVVVGGMGSILGSYLAALLIAVIQAFGILLFPEITLVLTFLIMAVVLALRPQGLLGRAETLSAARRVIAAPPLRAAGTGLRALGLALLAALIVLPFLASGYGLAVATEILIFVLFAASLQFLMGVGGMISFGHAAYLGLGAYTVALLVSHLGWPMAATLPLAPLGAGLGALLFGWFCVRLSGVYLAMLTLAFAQIAWSAAFQWYEITGGDNGILGVWPPGWADPVVFYYLALGLVVLAMLILRRIAFSPFGHALRAVRDASHRAEASGMDRRRTQWMGFTLAGCFSGLAGGLHAYLKGSVFPDVMAIPTSVDALVMTLLGGLHYLEGPILGAATFVGLRSELLATTELWRAAVGAIILVLVLLAPSGLAGLGHGLLRGAGGRR